MYMTAIHMQDSTKKLLLRNVADVSIKASIGLRIKVGSDVYDGSVQARLAALRERF